jgi:hypothetical protein
MEGLRRARKVAGWPQLSEVRKPQLLEVRKQQLPSMQILLVIKDDKLHLAIVYYPLR